MHGIRHLAVAALAAAALAGCGGGDDGDDEGAGATTETVETQTEAQTETQPAARDTERPIDFELVEELTPEHLGKDPECPDGEFVESRQPLTTITEEAAQEASSAPKSYSCGGRVDQVIWAEFDTPQEAQELLDPGNNSNAASLVSGNTAVLVNFGVEPEVSIKEFFDEIQQRCDCGETRYEGS